MSEPVCIIDSMSSARVFTSDLRVQVTATGLSTYPDVTVVCGRTQRAANDPHAVVNPLLIAEITSNSTEDYDRGEKLNHYKSLATLREVLIVCHREPQLSLWRREEEGWTELRAGRGEVLQLKSVAARLAVDDAYRDALEDVGA